MAFSSFKSPFFVVGTGRSGTKLMQKIFSSQINVDSKHEYQCEYIQRLAFKYYSKLISIEEVEDYLKKNYIASILYSKKEYWCDCSNKISWLIKPVSRILDNSKFIFIIRDGRKVVSSFYNKLNDEIYDDISTKIIIDWIDEPYKNIEPPPEKKYWWNIPLQNKEEYKRFKTFNQFERICWHWKTCNLFVRNQLQQIPKTRYKVFKLEELTKNSSEQEKLFKFLDLDFDELVFESIKVPHNVNKPIDFDLTEIQEKSFKKIVGDSFDELGYDYSKKYKVIY